MATLAQFAQPGLPQLVSDRLYQETEGLPYFVVAYLETMIAVAPEKEHDDATSWMNVDNWTMPRTVQDLLQTRLAAVEETARQLLQTAAVIGRSFPFDILREASGRSDEEAIAALETLLAARLVAEVGGRDLRYDFSHEQLRRLVYDQTSLARRRLLHRRVAEALANELRRLPDSGQIAGQVAHHYQLAGQDKTAATYFKLAGDHARALYANAEALAHYQAALALGYPDTAALHEAMGDLYTLRGEYGTALAAYETAAALTSAETPGRLEHKLGVVYHRRGEWTLAESHYQAAIENGGVEAAHLYADWSSAAHRQGQAERAQQLAQQALTLAETAANLPALAQAHNTLAILARHQEALMTARQHLEQSLALAGQAGDTGARAAALNNLALVYKDGGEFGQALGLLNEALALCQAQGDRHREAALHNNIADLLHTAGRQAEAMSHLKQAVTIYADIGVEACNWQPEIWRLTEW